jgi:hypothetical protein
MVAKHYYMYIESLGGVAIFLRSVDDLLDILDLEQSWQFKTPKECFW